MCLTESQCGTDLGLIKTKAKKTMMALFLYLDRKFL